MATPGTNNPSEAQNLPATATAGGELQTISNTLPTTSAGRSGDRSRMQNLLEMQEKFGTLPRPKQIQLLVGISAALVLVIAILMWTLSVDDYKLLYGKLETGDAAAIAEVLAKDGIPYRLDEVTGEILVDPKQIHEIRMKLATMSLPRKKGEGYEILDKDQGFGTSQFMENARYHRALEGELARSIADIEGVESARVHLAIPKQSVFVRDRREPSASVMVTLTPGKKLLDAQIAAIVHLVASSIPELQAEKVTVVNQLGDMLTKEKLPGQMAMSSAQFDYKRGMEDYYIQRIERILMPIVGFEGVRAQVDAEIDYSAVERTQESFNPDLPAVRSEQVIEEQSRGGDVGGVPGALTNTPPGAANSPETLPQANADGSAAAPPSRSSKRSTYNYELDRTISHTQSAPGSVRRLSVAVVVDDKMIINSDGSTHREPLTPEELDRLSNLVKEAVGFSLQRGDSLNVMNASFMSGKELPPPPELPFWKQPWFFEMLKQGGGILLAVFLIMMLIRPVLRELKPKEEEVEEVPLDVEEGSQVLQAVKQGSASMGILSSGLSAADWEAMGLTQEEYQLMLDVLRKTVTEDPRLVAQVVKTWVMTDDGAEGR
ncbi:MAG: flagellar basal-body MS-ring/collar protein FliF [Gammaproteobacteria bacterium]|nr:flagellar basal-body MS-ring/collar protein FliF [Gammaproteobacteria bacterium]